MAQRINAMNKLHKPGRELLQACGSSSKANQDCQQAWCMNRVLLKLAPELTGQNETKIMAHPGRTSSRTAWSRPPRVLPGLSAPPGHRSAAPFS